MALENKAQKAKRELREAMVALPEIVKATQAGSFMYTPEVIFIPLVKEGLVEVNEEMINPNDAGQLATRATQKGVEKVMSEVQNNEVVAAAPSKPVYAILKGIAIPAAAPKKRGGRKESKYQFEAMEIGDSFFVPVSAEVPDPMKTMASTVVNANGRYAVPVFNEDGSPKMRTVKNKKAGTEREEQATKLTRVFKVAEYELEGVKGALVYRDADAA